MNKVKKPSASSRAMGKAVAGVGYFIIALVVLYSDVMTVKLLWSHFPDGLLRYSAVGGVFATGMTIIALVVGKSHWFRPGGQMNWAWVCTFVELIISVLNVIAAFNPDGMAWWVLVMPATPILAVVTWILMIFFSPERAQLHAQMEMEDEKAQAELDYAKAEHEAHMEVKTNFLSQYTAFLAEEASSPANLALLRQGAHRMSQSVISGIIGSPVGMNTTNYIAQSAQSRSDVPAPKEVTGTLKTVSPTPAVDAEDNKPESIITKIKNVVTGGSKDESPLAPVSLSQEATIPEPPATNGKY